MDRKINVFREFLDCHTITIAHCFRLAKVHQTTFNRWLDGTSNPPAATLELLRLHATGEPPSPHNEWQGWCFTQGKLFTPSNRGHAPSEILMLPMLHGDSARLRVIEQSYTLQHKLF